MDHPPQSSRGYSLIELLVVLSVVGILAVAGAFYMGGRRTSGVKAMLDELEGTVMAAHKLAVTTGRDITLVSKGGWSKEAPLNLTYGDTTRTPEQILADIARQPGSFSLRPDLINHTVAGVVAGDSSWWTEAGQGNEDILAVEPFKSQDGFKGVVDGTAASLFKGSSISTVDISGTNKRFNQTFWIKVVSLRNGTPEIGGPMGLLLVQQNTATVFKFYTPGVRGGDKTWRRI